MMSLSILIAYRKIKVCVRQLAVASTTRIDDKKRSLKLPQTSNANSTVARHIPQSNHYISEEDITLIITLFKASTSLYFIVYVF